MGQIMTVIWALGFGRVLLPSLLSPVPQAAKLLIFAMIARLLVFRASYSATKFTVLTKISTIFLE